MSAGFNNMLHFIGIVEDSNDMTNSGRVKVRAFGIHPPRKGANGEDDVPTDHLPWATVLDGTYGLAPVIPGVGEFVFGFFIDGRDAQQPFITGRIPGMNLAFPAGAGEPGEDGYIPPESIHRYAAPEMHRYNTGMEATKGQSVMQASFVDSEIPQADGEVFDEPDIVMPERNLDNRVIQSKNGDNFLVVGDGQDTDGNGYMLLSHSSGSVFQIDSQGTILVKSYGDTVNSVDGVHTQYVKGSSHTNIQEDYTLRVERGSGKIYINGDLDIVCNDFNVQARGTMNLNAGGKLNMSGGGVGIQATADDINLAALNSTKIKTGSVTNGGGFYVDALFGDFNIDSYKMNLLSATYTKIHAIGTPAISLQALPYPDAGMNGVDISSSTGVKLQSNTAMNLTCLTNLGISSVGTLGLSAGGLMNLYSVGALGIGATAAVSIDSINPIGSVLLGSGTAALTAVGAAGNLTASLATFVAPGHVASTNIPNLSITEKATVVKPPDIPGPRPVPDTMVERVVGFFTSLMGSGDSLKDDD